MLLRQPDFPRINQLIKEQYGSRKGATQDANQLHDLLDAPSKHVWVTFEDGCLWWCTVRDGAVINPRNLLKNSFDDRRWRFFG